MAIPYDIPGEQSAVIVQRWLPSKRLRRLPHLFCRVLELPVSRDTSVQFEESPSSLTFKVELPLRLPNLRDIHAEVIHIVPGVIKVCVAGVQRLAALLDELDVLLWRYRLPASCLPEASVAVCGDDGVLVLTVPKASSSESSPPHPHQVTLPNDVSFPDAEHGPIKASDTQNVDVDSSKSAEHEVHDVNGGSELPLKSVEHCEHGSQDGCPSQQQVVVDFKTDDEKIASVEHQNTIQTLGEGT